MHTKQEVCHKLLKKRKILKKRKKRRKKEEKEKEDILISSSKREYNQDSLMRREIEKGNMIQEAPGKWPCLITTFGLWSSFKYKTPTTIFEPLYPFLYNPLYPWPRYKLNKVHIDCWMIAMIFIRINLVTRWCDW